MDNSYSRYNQERQEQQQQQANLGTFVAGIAVGAMIGSVVTLLSAPQAGEKTRHELEQELTRASARLRRGAEEGVDDGRQRMEHTIRDLEREIKTLRDRVEHS